MLPWLIFVIVLLVIVIIRLLYLYLPVREAVRNYTDKEKIWDRERKAVIIAYADKEKCWGSERKELNDLIRTLIAAREHKIKVQLLDSIYAIHKYDILFDYNITEYMTNNKIDWADISKDIIASILALESSGGLTSSVIALRRINQGKNGRLEYSFEQLKYNR